MGMRALVQRTATALVRGHGGVKSFAEEVEAAGIVGRVDGGIKTIPVKKIVGSVGRAATLRSDFFYKSGKVTGRYLRIGEAMRKGKELPPIEVIEAKQPRRVSEHPCQPDAVTEYYVVDGHHRVAMAKKLGQDFLDARVVKCKVAGTAPQRPQRPQRPQGAATVGAA